MKTSEILMKAKAALLARGWCQGSLERNGRVCAVGAITAGLYGHPQTLWSDPPLVAALDLFQRTACGKPMSRFDEYRIGPWNDAPERTLQDVYDAFDAAIAIAEQEEAAAVRDAEAVGTR